MWPFKRKPWEKLGNAYASQAVRDALDARCAEQVNLRDRDYRAIPASDFEQIIFDCWFPHDEPAYKSEIFDCDDFAVCFMAAVKTRWAEVSRGKESLAFGYVAADVKGMGMHAFIWHLNDKGNITFYEPQTGKPAAYICNSIVLMES